MRKIILISLISTILFSYGCKKEENIKKLDTAIYGNNKEQSYNIESLEIISENGSVIQNAAAPLSENDTNDLMQAVNNKYDANSQDKIDEFISAVLKGEDTTVLENYINSGMDINVMNKKGENAVSAAVDAGSMDALRFLITNGANLNNTSDTGLPPISQAILKNNMDAFDMLLNSGKVDLYYIWGDMWTGTPLYAAVYSGNKYAVEKLVTKGLDINYSYQEYGALPVMLYALSQKNRLNVEDYKEMVEYLASSGLNINTSDSNGVTPLMYSLKNGDVDGFKALISNNADVSLKDKTGKTALDYYNQYIKPSNINDDTKLQIEKLLLTRV